MVIPMPDWGAVTRASELWGMLSRVVSFYSYVVKTCKYKDPVTSL